MARLTLPATKWVSDGGVVYMAVQDKTDLLATSSNGSPTKARRMLQSKVLDILRAEELRERHWGRRLIVTKEGSVFLVEYRNGWQYSITRAGSQHASSCLLGGETTLEETMSYARRHVESAFGGVAFEAPI